MIINPAMEISNTNADTFTTVNGYAVAHIAGICRNKNQTGIGVWFGPSDPNNVSRVIEELLTDNRAAILACIEALEILNRKKIKKAKIFTCNDSLAKCISFNWIERWSQNNWTTKEGFVVRNKDVLLRLAQLKADFMDIDCSFLGNFIICKEMEEAKKLANGGIIS